VYKESYMNTKLIVSIILLTLSLFAAACAGQNTTSEPGDVTAVNTAATESVEVTATEDAGEVVPTSTGEAEEAATSVPEGGDTTLTPTVSAEEGTPAAEAGGTPGIPQTGPGDAGLPDDLDEVVRVLRTAGASVDLGEAVENDLISASGQSILINGEEVQIFTYASAEELESVASQLENSDPESEPQFYKLGNMLVFYAGTDTLVRDLLEDVLGAQAAGQ
jgi:hypothetical protein